jgi:UDP-N-acetylmuramoyl-tripeptide--D-alanyl-D-alanine ligase
LNIEALYHIFTEYPTVSTDTRKITNNCIFFALKGENFNGNVFASEALSKGAAYVVVDEKLNINDERIIFVNNVLETLQELAKYHRKQFSVPFIAITGSNGKTTTKELLSVVLSSQYKTYTTQGNLNNHIGVPLTILSIRKDAEMVVIEMGANHQKEIEQYCSFTLPNYGIITNCGKAHLEGFGGEEGVKKGKGELFDFLRKNNGTAFVFNDYSYLVEMSEGINKVIEYGTSSKLLTGKILLSDPFLMLQVSVNNVTTEIKTNLVGGYNYPNVLTAISVGVYFNIPIGKIKNAIEDYTPTNSRSQFISIDSNHYILDAYNANPSSMKAAIENFAMNKAAKKVIILGAMMELGTESVNEHQQIINLLQKYNWDNVVITGGDFKHTKHNYMYKESNLEVKEWLNQKKFNNTHFLIKGSRSMQMEKVL